MTGNNTKEGQDVPAGHCTLSSVLCPSLLLYFFVCVLLTTSCSLFLKPERNASLSCCITYYVGTLLARTLTPQPFRRDCTNVSMKYSKYIMPRVTFLCFKGYTCERRLTKGYKTYLVKKKIPTSFVPKKVKQESTE